MTDPRFAGFTTIAGQTIDLRGYRVSLDTSEMMHAVEPVLLDWSGGSLSPGVHAFNLIPGAGYGLRSPGSGFDSMRLDLRTDGRISLTDAPAGVTLISERTRCGVPDRIETPLQILTYGSPRGRWSRGGLTVSINFANAPVLASDSAEAVIRRAFAAWQAVSSFFSFTFVAANGDIQVAFGGRELYSKFGAAGGVAGYAPYPERGRLFLDSSETWTASLLLSIALHEIGHALGLAHSDDPASIMFPFASMLTTLDAESIDAIRNLYGWRPQIALADRATQDRPSLAVSSIVNLTSAVHTLHMVWRGPGNDQSIYESVLDNNVWTAQRLVPGIASSQSPSITSR